MAAIVGNRRGLDADWAGVRFELRRYARHYVEIFTERPKLPEMLIWELPYWFLWAAIAPRIFWLTQRFRLERGRLVRNSLIHAAACIALAHRAVDILITWALRVPAYNDPFQKVLSETSFKETHKRPL